MKFGVAGMLFVSSTLILACTTQPQLPQIVESDSADLAEPLDPQLLREIRVTAKAVALSPPMDSDVVCQRITPTGSHLSKPPCDRSSSLRRQREEAQEGLRSDGLDGSVSGVFSVPTR